MPKICAQASLQPLHTLGFPAQASFLVQVEEPEQIPEVIAFAQSKNLPVIPLGGGSNLLIPPQVKAVLLQQKAPAIDWKNAISSSLELSVPAGYSWPQLVTQSTKAGWFGLENLALIPGQAGAAPVQNIGAYGVELSSCLQAVTGYWLEGKNCRLDTLPAADCALAYRSSRFKHAWQGKFIITQVHLKLERQGQLHLGYADLEQLLKNFLATPEGANLPLPAAVAAVVSNLRRSKLPDPKQLANAGSYFTNPVVSVEKAASLLQEFPELPNYPAPAGVKLAAAWLIQAAGFKGKRQGNVGVHKNQALVLVHFGGGKLQELLELEQQIIAGVEAKFGVRLEREPRLLSF